MVRKFKFSVYPVHFFSLRIIVLKFQSWINRWKRRNSSFCYIFKTYEQLNIVDKFHQQSFELPIKGKTKNHILKILQFFTKKQGNVMKSCTLIAQWDFFCKRFVARRSWNMSTLSFVWSLIDKFLIWSWVEVSH